MVFEGATKYGVVERTTTKVGAYTTYEEKVVEKEFMQALVHLELPWLASFPYPL